MLQKFGLQHRRGRRRAPCTNSTFGFHQHKSHTLKKPKELFFSQRLEGNDMRNVNFACQRASHRQENE